MSDQPGINIENDASYDLIIIGAGAAGLSLLVYLYEANYDGSVLVLEANNTFENDRTWSFWKSPVIATSIQNAIDSKWDSWSLECSNESVILQDESIPYCSLPAGALHKIAFDIVEKNLNFSIVFDQPVESLHSLGKQHLVKSKDKTYSATYIVDTRPPKVVKPSYGLLQCFVGLEIETADDTFIKLQQGVQLMHDLKSTENGLEFVYILPFSEKRALIEFTGFYQTATDYDYLLKRANEYVSKAVGQSEYKVLREEYATLPMFNIHNQDKHSNMIKGGVAGGAMRASTGYSFLSIQRWASSTAKLLTNKKPLVSIESIPRIYRWMDAVFLRVLNDHKAKGPLIFMRFAKSVSPGTFARFMSEQASWIDILRVVLAMPKWIFIKAAFQNTIDGVFIEKQESKD